MTPRVVSLIFLVLISHVAGAVMMFYGLHPEQLGFGHGVAAVLGGFTVGGLFFCASEAD